MEPPNHKNLLRLEEVMMKGKPARTPTGGFASIILYNGYPRGCAILLQQFEYSSGHCNYGYKNEPIINRYHRIFSVIFFFSQNSKNISSIVFHPTGTSFPHRLSPIFPREKIIPHSIITQWKPGITR